MNLMVRTTSIVVVGCYRFEMKVIWIVVFISFMADIYFASLAGVSLFPLLGWHPWGRDSTKEKHNKCCIPENCCRRRSHRSPFHDDSKHCHWCTTHHCSTESTKNIFHILSFIFVNKFTKYQCEYGSASPLPSHRPIASIPLSNVSYHFIQWMEISFFTFY